MFPPEKDKNVEEIYQYQHLPGPDSIRILILLPAKDSTHKLDIQFEISQIGLSSSTSECGSYSTLSYVWGYDRDTHAVYVGASKLSIGHNLHSALVHLRHHDRPIKLWADALCINQLDTRERNQQVRQMHAIYSSAQQTVIYLGEYCGNTGLSACNFLERQSLCVESKGKENDDFKGDLEDVENDVLTRSWFRRVWVLQEVVVSKNVCIHYGHIKISWDEFCRILLLSPRYHDRYGLSIYRIPTIEAVRGIFQARSAYREYHGLSMHRPLWHTEIESYSYSDSADVLHTLSRGRRLEASDPRDKIFALLGISTGIDLNDERFAISYEKTCIEVYTDFARHIMETTNSYDALSYIDEGFIDTTLDDLDRERYMHDSEPQLPSWVPNWDRSRSMHWSTRRTILSTLAPETECQKEQRKDLVSKSRTWSDSSKTLVALGSIVGKVKQIGSRIVLQGRDEVAFQEIRDRYPNSPVQVYELIMSRWKRMFEQSRANRGLGLIRRVGDPPEYCKEDLSNISRLLSTNSDPPNDSVEYHIFTRARQTVTWTDDNNKAVAAIEDKNSIVDGMFIAQYVSQGPSQERRLAILPPEAKTDDLIVCLSGARVPFLVRLATRTKSPGQQQETKDDLGENNLSSPVECRIIGECLANGLGDLAGQMEPNTVETTSRAFAIH